MTSTRTTPGAGSGLVVAAQILEWKAQIWDFWCGVAHALEAQGQQLVLLSPWTPPGGATWPVVLPMPYAIGEFTPDARASMAHDPAWDHLLATDDLYRTFLPPSRKAGQPELASLQAYVRAIFEELAPDVVLGWAPPFPPSRLILGEAWRREIPSFGLEIGFLPNSLMVESRDVGFGSDLISHPAVSDLLAAHVPSVERMHRIRESYRAAPRDIANLRVADPAPLVVLLGSCPGFNLQPRESRQIQLGSPWFGTFEEAAEALRAAVPAGTRLVLRPHPADVEGQRYSRRPDAPGALVNALSIRALIEEADAVVVLGGTRTQLEVALLDVPVVLLSRSVLWGQGIAHEYGGGDLAPLVSAALAREGRERRRAEADRLLDFIAAHALYGLPGSPAARGPADFARFLGRFGLGIESEADRRQRLSNFGERVAPLLAPYVCREVSTAQRPMRAVYEPYLEAALADLVVRSGEPRVVICGADDVARRIGARLASAGVDVEAYVDDDPSCGAVDGVPVLGCDALGALSATTVVLASHGGEDALRQRLQAGGSSQALRLIGPSTTVLGDAASMAQLDAPEQLWMTRGHQYAGRGDWEAASAAFEAARQARPDWPEPLYRQALALRHGGASPEPVWARMSEAVALGGDAPGLVTDAGFAAFAAGEYDAAETLAIRACEAWVDASYPWHLRALCARQRGLAADAILSLLQEAAARTPMTPELAFDLASALHLQGDVAGAEARTRDAIAARPAWSAPWYLLGVLLRTRQAPAEEILAAFEGGLAAEPITLELAIDAGFAALVAGQPERADALAQQAASLQPDWSVPWHLRALAARARGERTIVIAELLHRAMRGTDTSPELAFDAACAAFDLGTLDEALRHATQAAKARPDWVDVEHLQRAIRLRLTTHEIRS
jgi:tetratricopeptide (TPR) repeat protein